MMKLSESGPQAAVIDGAHHADIPSDGVIPEYADLHLVVLARGAGEIAPLVVANQARELGERALPVWSELLRQKCLPFVPVHCVARLILIADERDVTDAALDGLDARYRVHEAYGLCNHPLVAERPFEHDLSRRNLCVDAKCRG